TLRTYAARFASMFTRSIYKWVQAPLSVHVGALDLERERALQLPVVQQNEWGEVEGGEPARGKKPRKRADSSAPDNRARATERTTRRTGRAVGKWGSKRRATPPYACPQLDHLAGEYGVNVPRTPATQNRPMRTVFLLLLACAAAACGADSPARDSLVAVVDSVNGVERLSYPADAATPLAWHFDTLAVIGGAMVDDENYQFQTGAMGLAGNADGDLFLSDTQGKRVLRYDSTGTFVRSYGREGAGPGELRFPVAAR